MFKVYYPIIIDVEFVGQLDLNCVITSYQLSKNDLLTQIGLIPFLFKVMQRVHSPALRFKKATYALMTLKFITAIKGTRPYYHTYVSQAI